MHRVVALVPPGIAPFELGIVVEVFGLDRPELDVPWWYQLVVAAERPGRVPATAGGFSFEVEHGLEALADADTIVVPGWNGEPSDAVVDAVRASDARLVSICSGVFLLAAAGVLDGREAATHWRYAGELAERYPSVRVNADVLYVDGGDVLTSAGSAAGIDLCLHVVRRDHGAAVANAVARRLVIPPHRDGGQAQLVELPMPARPEDDPIARVMEWALRNLERPLDLETMAARAYMSVRTFTRRFRRATGTTPGRWLLEQRVRASLPLLEAADEPIETVAARVGFGSAATYRHHFAAIMRTSPTAYRRAFYAAAE
ncbi:MAG TPA: helix-turn-helix domain-containing protein [Solirubrobacter sp.]|nr:helix-turn-helix domain-containing protein [Solirubrobacter sp.]